tara:strand:+ start:144 stop:566 length:423 start_codon:yes stop_codon:yes gene_type:complete
MKSTKKTFNNFVKNLNESKLVAAIALIILNIGSKHVDIDLTPAQEVILKHALTKQLLIFSIAWVGSKDIYVSLFITCGYVILTEILLNRNSSLNMLPEHLKKMEEAIDTNNDGVIQEKELNKAIEIINKYKKNIKNNGNI